MSLSEATMLVVDDDDFTRTLVTTLVKSLEYDVLGSAGTVADAMALARETKPTIAVLDLDLGEGPTGIDLAHGLRKIDPNIALVLLTSYGDPTWMGLQRRPPAGARYVVKGSINDPSVLGDAIASALADPYAQTDATRTNLPLSEGQWEILRLVAAGYSNAEIAKRRSLTVDAVNKAVSRLVKQLGIDVAHDGNTRVMLTQAFNRTIGTISDRRT